MFPDSGNGKGSEASTSTAGLSQGCCQFKFDEILLATENFNESLVVGKGGFGKVYKGNISIGTTHVDVAIKRLDLMSNQGAKEFWAEVEMLSKLRHAHLVSLIGYCNYEKEMILVYEYMSHGTLEDHLHKLHTSLSWLERLKICIGAARGLDYLHTGTGIEVGVIHRDVKSSNILLHESWAAKISDFGLARITPTNQPSTYAITLVKGTFGYIDPNYFATGKLTRRSDVYAFGVVLFEVLCQKRPLDESFECGLATWIQESIKEGNLKQIVYSGILSEISPKCLKGFARIAERCLDNNPHRRPTMTEVVFSLESLLAQSVLFLQQKTSNWLQTPGKKVFGRIFDVFLSSPGENLGISISPDENSGTPISRGEKSGVFLGNGLPDLAIRIYKAVLKREDKLREKHFKRNGGLLLQHPTLNGEDAIERTTRIFSARELEKATDKYNNNRVVGRGGNGTVYKGVLPDAKIVAVKKSVLVDETQIESFINEIFLLSQISHRNVVKLLGCCLETEVPVLVYEFVSNGNLFQFIHDENYEFPTFWSIRITIATEVAGAIAYMHTAPSVPIYHRDIKSSNILLDEKLRAKLSDFGISRTLTGDQTHVTTLVKGTYGYIDPEYFQSSQFTEKSDVYSFGIVLAELLTGKKPIYSIGIGESRTLALLILSMEEGLILENIDDRVSDGPKEQLIAVAKLAKRCLNLNGRLRPTMKEVATELEGIRSSGL